MNKITNPALAAIMAVCALLLGIGNLAIANALQPHYLNNAIIYFVCGIGNQPVHPGMDGVAVGIGDYIEVSDFQTEPCQFGV